MRSHKVFLKVLLIIVVISAIFLATVAIFVKVIWKPAVEKFLSDTLGVRIEFRGATLNLEASTITLRGVKILSDKDFKRNTFYADECTLAIDRDVFKQKRKILVNEVIIEGGELNVERNRRGIWNIAHADPLTSDYSPGVAYAATRRNTEALYTFVKNIHKVSIRNAKIILLDNYIPGGPLQVNFYGFDFYLNSKQEHEASYIPVNIDMGFSIMNDRYKDSKVRLQGNFNAYQNGMDADIVINTSHVDLMQFLPYFETYTPFSFNDGLFSSTTECSIRGEDIDCLTTMLFHKLKLLLIRERLQNALFLETSVNKLAPYLTRSGEIVFDFVIKNTLSNPKFGLGPRVKYAITLVTIQEVNKFMQTLQKLRR